MRLTACVLAVALASTGCSQIVIVPPAPDGSSTTVDVSWDKGNEKGNTTLDRQGYAFYVDRIQDVVYRIGEDDIEAQFGPALAPMREILAAGLPDLPHSYAALLEPPDQGPLGTLSIQVGDGPAMVVAGGGQGVFIDGYPDRPHAIDSARIVRDFGPALASLTETLKTLRSYIILLDSPDGAASKVVFRTRGEEILLDHSGQSLTLDGLDHEADGQLAEKDFTPARTSTRQILDAGLPTLPHSYVALVANPAGPLGEVRILEGIAEGTTLDQPWQAVIIDGYSNTIYALDEAQYDKDFGDSMAAMPPAPETYLLYFESGGTRLAPDSRATVPLILEAARRHPAADISISGHTDTVGNAGLNEALSRKRGDAVARLILNSQVPVLEISQDAYGKTRLAIETPDNTPELLNRRVEITIR